MIGGPARTVFFVVGEESGDRLGARLMPALRARLGASVRMIGVGGEGMAAEGLRSLFPISETSIVGFSAVIARLPSLLRRIRQTADAAIEAAPDVVVLIDSPDFTHAVARRIRRRAPHIPIVDYVSPSVWAWRPGRARRMRAYVDHILALMPFEPEAHRRLGGPDCTYVGHPLIERLATLRPAPGERPPLEPGRAPTLLVLPGSRRSEIRRLMPSFGVAVERIAAARGPVEVLLPAVEHLAAEIEILAADWPVRPTILRGEEAKFAAFRRAHAALAASGTVTLELALSGVPMAVAYRTGVPNFVMKRVLLVPTIILPNLMLDEQVVREYLNGDANPDALAAAILPLLSETPERAAQLAAFGRLDAVMSFGSGTPSERGAAVIADLIGSRETGAADRSGRG